MTVEKRWHQAEAAAGLLLTLLLVAWIAESFTPLHHLPNTDSAVFLYIGREMLSGGLPYVDVWDHKGPLIYYLNMFGLWAGSGLWGVWCLQFILFSVSLYSGYLALRKAFGALAAAVAVLCGSGALALFARGNLTEEYAVCFNLIALAVFFQLLERPSNRWLLGAAGAAFAASFLLRPNNAGFPMAIAICLCAEDALRRDFQGLGRKVLWIVAGMLAVSLPILAHLFIGHALYDMYDQFFRYNFFYVAASRPIGLPFWSFARAMIPFMIFCLLPGYLISLIAVWRSGLRAPIAAQTKIALLLVIAMPLEAFLINLSGRALLHYSVLWVPTIMLAGAILVGRIVTPTALVRGARPVLAGLVLATGWATLPLILQYAEMGRQIAFDRASGIEKRTLITRYVGDHSTPDEQVLFWGHGGSLIYSVQRQSVTRFLYQQPLISSGYTTTAMLDEFRLDITQNRPVLIIEKKRDFIPLDPAELSAYRGYVPALYHDIIRFIGDNYHLGFENEFYRVLEIDVR